MEHSEKVENAIAELEERGGDPYGICDGACTAGYDNDGSTGFDIFENGVALGQKAFGDYHPNAPRGYGSGKIFYAHLDDGGAGSMLFFLGEEKDILDKIRKAK